MLLLPLHTYQAQALSLPRHTPFTLKERGDGPQTDSRSHLHAALMLAREMCVHTQHLSRCTLIVPAGPAVGAQQTSTCLATKCARLRAVRRWMPPANLQVLSNALCAQPFTL